MMCEVYLVIMFAGRCSKRVTLDCNSRGEASAALDGDYIKDRHSLTVGDDHRRAERQRNNCTGQFSIQI